MSKGAYNALIMHENDNVATAIKDLEAGDIAIAKGESGTFEVKVLKKIPFGHKFALKDIPAGSAVTKYGETIGLASQDIRKGDHVHVHNVEGTRGRGDKVDRGHIK